MNKLIYSFFIIIFLVSCKKEKPYPKSYKLDTSGYSLYKQDSVYVSEILLVTSKTDKKAYDLDLRIFFHFETEIDSMDEFYFYIDNRRYDLEYIDEIQWFGEDMMLSFVKEDDRRNFLFMDKNNEQELLSAYKQLVKNITFWHERNGRKTRVPFLRRSKILLEIWW
ncbi:MAG: hypothetical protein U1C58_02485 [Flavobacteriaceae bacterium]|nr:hypothetical protein [Flavobacteriaceae bacterium]